MKSLRVLAGTLCTALTAQSVPAPASLLANLGRPTTVPSSSSPRAFTAVGGVVYFVANDGVHGPELFRSLGSAATTSLVADIRSGAEGSAPESLMAVGGRLLFTADDGVHGRELWVSDGTAAGTTLVADLVPGAQGIFVGEHAPLGARVVLDIDDGTSGREPWVSDGSAAGTVRLADIAPGVASSRGSSRSRAMGTLRSPAGDAVAFLAQSTLGIELWRTDGTPAGTRGTGAVLHGSAILTTLAVSLDNGRIVCAVVPSASLGGTGSFDVWSSDGTSAGTGVVSAVTGIGVLATAPRRIADRACLAAGGSFAAVVTDGTTAGTVLMPLASGAAAPVIHFAAEVRGALYGFGRAGATDEALYRIEVGANVVTKVGDFALAFDSSQTAAGIGDRLVVPTIGSFDSSIVSVDVTSAAATPLVAFPSRISVAVTEALGRAWFAGYDPRTGIEPSSSDGTLLGTAVIRDLALGSTSSGAEDSRPFGFAPVGDRTAFFATVDNATSLWTTDGTELGTREVYRGNNLGTNPLIIVAGSKFYFVSGSPSQGDRLYVSEGTPASTRLIDAQNPDPVTLAFVEIVALGNEVLFLGRSSTQSGLFATDGTNVRLVHDLDFSSFLYVVVRRFGEQVLMRFVGRAASFDAIVVTDGTTAGTRPVANASRVGTHANSLAVWEGRGWFVSSDSTGRVELFATDGTAAGTAAVGELQSTLGGPNEGVLVPAAERLWIVGSAGVWYVDSGTTQPIAASNINVRPFHSNARPEVVGNRLVYEGLEAGVGRLFATDGWSTTRLPGIRNLVTRGTGFVPLGERHLLYLLTDQATGTVQLWVTDGSVAGTRRLQETEFQLFPSAGSGLSRCAAVSNGRVYLRGRDPIAGIEPFVLDPGAITERRGAGCGGSGRDASLDAHGDPELGMAFELIGHGRQGGAAVLLFSGAPASTTTLPFATHCALEVQPDFVVFPAVAVTGGSFRYALTIPDEPAIVGLQVAFQAALGRTDAALGFDLTNGVLATLGR